MHGTGSRFATRSIAMIVMVAFVPGIATAQLLLGTGELPELPDDQGDVYYMPTYSQTGDYLDLTAAWFEYDNATDSIVLTIRTANGETLADSPQGFVVSCDVGGNVTLDGKHVGTMLYLWRQPLNRSGIDTFVIWDSQLDATGSAALVEHAFAYDLGKPAYFRYTIPRPFLLRYGDAFEDPVGACRESLAEPTGLYPSGGFLFSSGFDNAQSAAKYSFADHQQVRAPDGNEPVDPVEAFERHDNATATNATTLPVETEKKTPGPVPLLVLATVMFAALVRRRTQ